MLKSVIVFLVKISDNMLLQIVVFTFIDNFFKRNAYWTIGCNFLVFNSIDSIKSHAISIENPLFLSIYNKYFVLNVKIVIFSVILVIFVKKGE